MDLNFTEVAKTNYPVFSEYCKPDKQIDWFLKQCVNWKVAYRHGVIYRYTDPFDSQRSIYFFHYRMKEENGISTIRIFFGTELDRTPIKFGSEEELPPAFLLPDLCVEVRVDWWDSDGSVNELHDYELIDPRTDRVLHEISLAPRNSEAWRCWELVREFAYRYNCVCENIS